MHRRLLFQYCVRLAALALAFIVATVLGVAWRDPFDLYGLLADSGRGFRAGSPDRQAKAYAVMGAEPDAVILGGSRAFIGYWTQHIGWAARRSYNLGLSGASIYETRRMLQHAAAIGELKQVLITLDFESFRSDFDAQGDSIDKYMIVTPAGWPSFRWVLSLIAATFSVDAVNRAMNFRAAGERLYDENGNGLHAQVRLPKTLDVFRNVANSQLMESARWLHPNGYPDYGEEISWQIEEFRKLLEAACGEGAAVYVIINPLHVSLLQIMEELGSLDVRDRWRATIFEAFNAQISRGCGVSGFWDFTSFVPYTQEPLPFLEEATDLPRYWIEPSHFTPALGQHVLDEVIRSGTNATAGHRVQSDIELHALIASDHQRLRQWQAANPSMAQHVTQRSIELPGR